MGGDDDSQPPISEGVEPSLTTNLEIDLYDKHQGSSYWHLAVTLAL